MFTAQALVPGGKADVSGLRQNRVSRSHTSKKGGNLGLSHPQDNRAGRDKHKECKGLKSMKHKPKAFLMALIMLATWDDQSQAHQLGGKGLTQFLAAHLSAAEGTPR